MALLEFVELTPRRRPNWYLVAPPGLTPHVTPHREAPRFPFDRPSLITRVHTLLSREPQITVLESSPDGGRLRLVQRTPIVRWPDFVDIEVMDDTGGDSTLAIYSRSKFGNRDFGVNRKRVERWLAELEGRG